MHRGALIAAVAAVVFALSAGMLYGPSNNVEAGKPQLVPDGASIASDGNGNCIVTVTWHGLHGGKPMWINTWLTEDGQNVNGTGRQAKVRSGDGEVQILVENVQAANGVDVSFSDNRFNPLGFLDGGGSC